MTDRVTPRPTALITGASSGIGYEFAKLFAEAGYDVVLIARNVQALEALASDLQRRHGSTAHVIAQDLSHPDAPQAIHAALQRASISVDVLVNNAGLGIYGPFTQTEYLATHRLLQVNIAALTLLTRLVLPDMLARRKGFILNVASTAAFQPGPFMATYYASKAYVLSFSEALVEELRGTGVSVTVLCPGPTRTSFQSRAGIEHINLLRAGLRDAGTVAKAGYSGMLNRRVVVIPGWPNRIIAGLVRVAPRGVVLRVVRWLQVSRHKTPQADAVQPQ